MKAIIIQFTFGSVAFDEKFNFKEIQLYEKDPKKAARILKEQEDGFLSSEIKSLVTQLRSKDFDTFSFENAEVARAIEKSFNIKVESINALDLKTLRSKMKQIAIESGFIESSEDLILWNRNVGLELAKLRIKGASEKRDLIIAQAIQTLDDLDRTVNLFIGRLREWYGVHFPELDRLIDKHETYSRLVLNIGQRKNFSISNLVSELIPEERAKKLSKAANNSMGAEMLEEDLNQIKYLSKSVLNFYDLRKNMEKYIDNTMEEVASARLAFISAEWNSRCSTMAFLPTLSSIMAIKSFMDISS